MKGAAVVRAVQGVRRGGGFVSFLPVGISHQSFGGLFLFLLLFPLPPAAGASFLVPAGPGRPKDPVKAIIQFRQEKDGPLFTADLLSGMDVTRHPWRFTDPKGNNIRVGFFAVLEPDGTRRSLRYQEKTLCPERMVLLDGKVVTCDIPGQRFLKDTLHLVRMSLWYEDLVRFYQHKVKRVKASRDPELRRRRLNRLYDWCNANFLYKYADQVKKELRRLEAKALSKERSRPEAPEAGGRDTAREEREAAILAAVEALPMVGEVRLRSSLHVVIVTDFLPEKEMEHLLDLGERVVADFESFMYDPDVEGASPIPEQEILRLFHFRYQATFEAALRRGRTLSPMGNVTNPVELERILKLGGNNITTLLKDRVLRTSLTCAEKAGEGERNRDFEDHLVHQLGHTLIANRLRDRLVLGGGPLIMPWLGEGMAVYMTLKHRGTKNTACVDFTLKKPRYANQSKKKRAAFHPWDADVEATVTAAALDKETEPFDVILRIPTYRRLGPTALAKAFSMIDFMIEVDRVGFLRFLQDLQEDYRILFKERDGAKFLHALDGRVKESFTGAAVKKGRKVVPLDSMAALEAAWKDWASHYVLKGTRR